MSQDTSEQELPPAIGPRHVIGLDIGDGESALCWLSTDPDTMGNKPEIFQRRTTEKSIITAIAWEHDEDGEDGDGSTRLLIGEAAVASEDCLQFSVNFKAVFEPEHEVMPRQALFSEALLREFFQRHPKVPEDCVVYVGHPAGWSTETVEAYAKQFEALDVPVRLMPESQSALVLVRDRHAENQGREVDRDALRAVLVVDVGSSTTDFTFVDDLEPRNLPVGATLGCRRIDDELAAFLRRELAGDKAFTEALATPGGGQMLRLVCRRAKEAQFSPGNRKEEQESDNYRTLPDACAPRFAPLIHTGGGRLRGLEIPQRVADPGGWADDFRALLADAKRQLGSDEPQLIIVTGGGSRMPVVREACGEAFPDAEVRNDPTPSFTVAQGLASAGRHRVSVERFRHDIRALKDRADFTLVIRTALLGAFGEMISLLQQRVEREVGKGDAESSTPLDEQIRELADFDVVFQRLRARLEASLAPLVLDICRVYGIRDDRFGIDLTVPTIVSTAIEKRIRGVLRTVFTMQDLQTRTLAIHRTVRDALQERQRRAVNPFLATAGALIISGVLTFGSAKGVAGVARWRLRRALKAARPEPTEITRLVEEAAESIAAQIDVRAKEIERFVLPSR
ncbi:Hsp70 family protein [Streptomyces fungicidicus]|uniref:Hsp70 family protein n=1 Tax=Streptomyces fungicidicus TaxID=68203 RepID=UPI003D706569